VYAVPGPDSFDVALNSELGEWGGMEPYYAMDVLHTKVPGERLSTPVEKFTISTVEAEGGSNVVIQDFNQFLIDSEYNKG
jgi:hypothetical protein